MSEKTTTIRMPSSYLAEKVERLHRLTDGFDRGLSDVPVWWLREIADAAGMIRDEAGWWIAEARRREEERRLSRTGGNSGGETP